MGHKQSKPSTLPEKRSVIGLITTERDINMNTNLALREGLNLKEYIVLYTTGRFYDIQPQIFINGEEILKDSPKQDLKQILHDLNLHTKSKVRLKIGYPYVRIRSGTRLNTFIHEMNTYLDVKIFTQDFLILNKRHQEYRKDLKEKRQKRKEEIQHLIDTFQDSSETFHTDQEGEEGEAICESVNAPCAPTVCSD